MVGLRRPDLTKNKPRRMLLDSGDGSVQGILPLVFTVIVDEGAVHCPESSAMRSRRRIALRSPKTSYRLRLSSSWVISGMVASIHALPTVSPDTRSPDQESGLGRGESHVLDFSRSTRLRKVNFCVFPEVVSGNVSAK
jgi:hypothetical protein